MQSLHLLRLLLPVWVKLGERSLGCNVRAFDLAPYLLVCTSALKDTLYRYRGQTSVACAGYKRSVTASAM